MPRVVGSDGTVSIVKIVSLSPRVENLNLKKVIKVSYLNQESRPFSCVLLPDVLVYHSHFILLIQFQFLIMLPFFLTISSTEESGRKLNIVGSTTMRR